MLVYLDSSLLVRAYLVDEPGHHDAVQLLQGAEHLLVTATWTVVEVTSALARACRSYRAESLESLLALVDSDVGENGPVTLLRADMDQVEACAIRIVRDYGLRSLDALHVAVAQLAARPLAEPGESMGFASRDEAQRAAAQALGFVCL